MHTIIPLTASLALLAGCNTTDLTSSAEMSGADMSAGVTQGGSQDAGLARQIIDGGGIPSQTQFSAQGLFSEHDLPISGRACRRVLCPRSAAAVINPVDGSGKQMLVQLGFGTKIQAETFERRPLNLSIALDVSGSMNGEKIQTVREAMQQMVLQLHEGDSVSLVLFNNSAQTVMGSTLMDAQGRAHFSAVIDDIMPGGGTDIEAGLREAYWSVEDNIDAVGTEHRVMLLTDAQPNIGGTELDTFSGMVKHFSEEGIGISVFGVGLDLGSELASEISNLPGGNSFFLADSADIESAFSEEFDYWVTPLAYDLDVEVAMVDELAVDQTWGTAVLPSANALQFGAATLFLSSKSGGMGITLDLGSRRTQAQELGEFDIAYETLRGKQQQASRPVSFEGGSAYRDGWVQADDLGVYRMAYLIDTLIALQSAAAYCEGSLDREEAVIRVDKAGDRLERFADRMEDEDMAREARLMRQLSTNLDAERVECAYGSGW
jgi:Ca-activated chloride channel family protein